MPALAPAPAYLWLAQPSPQEIARAGALTGVLTRTGRAAMVCFPRADGRLDVCRIDDAQTDIRFGAAILALKDEYVLDLSHGPPPREVRLGVTFPKLTDRALEPVATPTPAERRAAAPVGVEPAKVGLECVVTPQGETADCAVADEPAHDARLDAAALSLALRYRFKPPTLAGRPTGAFARVDVDLSGRVITNPNWASLPSADDLASAFPPIAMASGVSGKASIRCIVDPVGRLNDCTVVSELPTGMGFGDAALKVTPKFRMRPMTSDGRPVGGTITIPLSFVTDSRVLNASDSETFHLLSWAPWAAAPSAEDVAAVFPKDARARGVFGRAALVCNLTAEGRLAHCETTMEGPEGRGFGAAALHLAPKFRAAVEQIGSGPIRNTKVAISVDFSERSLSPAASRWMRQPQWRRTLDGGDLGAAFPTAAIQAGVLSGAATVDCRIGATGSLEACSLAKEAPAALGFGAAAVELAPLMQANLWTKDGEPAVGESIALPLRFVYAGPLGAPPPPQ